MVVLDEWGRRSDATSAATPPPMRASVARPAACITPRVRRRAPSAARASAPTDSDGAYFAKVAAASFAGAAGACVVVACCMGAMREAAGANAPPSSPGAAAVKYGSLALDAPFHPDPALAAALVVLPTLAYGAWLIVVGQK